MIKLYSYAKINLFLNVIDKLENGYHLIDTVMQSIDLHDEILVDTIKENTIVIETSDKSIPTDSKNTCYKAASLIKEIYNINSGVVIKLNKIIPSEAGLAGGSGNSAAVIKALNELWDLNMSLDEMKEIGLKVGADVPFCIIGGTVRAEGIGEKLTKLNDFSWENILIVKPDFSLSTAFVYNNLRKEQYNLYNVSEMLNNIEQKNFNELASLTTNTLERAVEEIHIEINEIKKVMMDNGAVSSMMTGSGSALFGLYPNKESLEKAYNVLINYYPKTYKTRTMDRGVDFIK